MNIKEALKYAINILKQNNQTEAVLKAKLLLAFVLKQKKEYLVTHDEEKLLKKEKKLYNRYITRILKNEPIQYILGTQEFMGLNFKVNKNVLIPRADTETLVLETLNIIEKNDYKILDLCTGSGSIAISLKNINKNSAVYASDISVKALNVAKQNAKENKVSINFIKSNLFNKIEEKFNIIVSNPPYIKTNIIKTLEKNVQKEPYIALDGGKDGLDIYRKIINSAINYLENEGFLALEIGYDQKEDIITLLEKTNYYKNIYSKKDLAGNDRIVVCQKK